jgi:hypothetical protein
MKTSNKLLMGFFGVILISLVIANVAVKAEIKNGNYKRNIEVKSDSVTVHKDSTHVEINF